MKRVLCALWLAGAWAGAAEPKIALPGGALLLETQPVKWNRLLALWTLNPKKVPRRPEEIYTCPEYSRGHYYQGATSVSLVDSETGKVLNSVRIKTDEETFDVPYHIQRFYYQVPALDAHREGKPKILALRDFNGDGQALEFAMFDQQACMGLLTALFGYSEKQDRVIQYPVELKSGGKATMAQWVDELFSRQAVAPGVWKYEIDYRGRGGTLDRYEVHYDRKSEKFVGTFSSTGG